MFFLLGYMLTSAINARASFNLETKEYTYFTEFTKNLPHSYDAKATWFLFWQYLGLIILFWATKDWLAGAKQSRNSSAINPRLKWLIIVICINGGIVALESILQRFHYGEFKGKLIFLLEPLINNNNLAQFGPFAYRSNSASYFNLIWPIGLGFLIQLAKENVDFGNKKLGSKPEIILIPCVILMAISPIISASRGGAIVMIGLLILVTLSIPLLRIKSKNVFATLIVCILFSLLAGYHFGWERLESRLMTIFTDNLSNRKHIYEVTIQMIDQYVFSNTSPSPFGSGPGSFQTIIQYELSSKLQYVWESWVHNDYLETILTFGIPGTIAFLFIILFQLILIVVKIFYQTHDTLNFFGTISLIGITVHAAADFPLQVHSITIMLVVILASITKPNVFNIEQN
jgi:O-antigen ligase